MTPPQFSAGSYEVVDLSLLLAEDLPCHWATHLPFQHKTYSWFETRRHPAGSAYSRGPYATRWMAIDEHTGTHLDAPTHFIPPEGSDLPDAGPAGSVSVDRVPLARLMGPAAVIDAATEPGAEPGTSPLIGPEAVTAWERDHGTLAAGDVVLLRTGWDRHYRRAPAGGDYVHDVVVTGRRPGWPAPAVATMELLLERGVRCIGIDAPSMGPAHDPRPVHVCGLRAEAVFVECLRGLDQLPPRGVWFCFLPLKLEGGTGSPGRAIALVPGSP
jgi:kynurenine formamidase